MGVSFIGGGKSSSGKKPDEDSNCGEMLAMFQRAFVALQGSSRGKPFLMEKHQR